MCVPRTLTPVVLVHRDQPFRFIVTDFGGRRNRRSRYRNDVVPRPSDVTHIATNRVRCQLLPGDSVPVSRINMRKMKDVLRLKLDAKLSHQRIATALGISKGVVTKYVGLAAAADLDWTTVPALDEAALEWRLLVAPEQPRDHVQPDYGRLHQMLRGKGMKRMLLWKEHRADHADAQTYSYSQYCENYRRFSKQLKRSMRQIHRAGEKLFIDYAGPTIALTDASRAHIFVAALHASSYTYACATPRETMAD